MENMVHYDITGLATGLKYIAVGLSLIAIGPIGAGIARIFSTLLTEISRNPSAKGSLLTFALIGFALTEAVAIYVLVVSCIMLFSN